MILPRKLWYFDELDRVVVDQDFLQTDQRPLVVLGEAGMGKSTLLGQLSSIGGYAVCTARKLINAPNTAELFGGATTLVIDALDEVSAQRDGDAVDLVLRRLGELGFPRFILSCRVADWRSATAQQGISEFYDPPPLQLHLEPLDRADAASFLAETLGRDEAERTIAHLEERGLSGLWSNPQTLELLEKVASSDSLPASKGDLFERATALLRAEHREEKAGTKLTELSEASVLSATGAAFAALILTGAETLTRRVNDDREALPIHEVAGLPSADVIGGILDSRLFAAPAAERFSYTHRAIGEFLGAQWLSQTADTPRKRRRLLELFNTRSLVPASLRGIHAWLAWHSPDLALQVIADDPMGVVEYGDADNLTPTEARALLSALKALARENPRFHGWSDYRVAGLIQPELLPDIRDALTDPSVEFGIKLLILRALRLSGLVAELADTFRLLVLDYEIAYANRAEAGARLASLDAPQDWQKIVQELLVERDEDSIRLADELLEEIEYSGVSVDLIFDVVVAQLNRTETNIGIYRGLERKLPAEHLDELLDRVSAYATKMGDRHQRQNNAGITDLAYGLLARRLNHGAVDVARLWSWLRPFSNNAIGYRRETREVVADFFAKNDGIRRALQSLVLLEEPGDKSVWERFWRLNDRSSGLNVSDEDVIWLLDQLELTDGRWRDLVQLVRHSSTEGLPVRNAAARFAGDKNEDSAWLERIADPQIPDWQLEQDARKRKEEKDREEQWKQHRSEFGAHLDDIRAGEYGWVVGPAKAYLGLFWDIGNKDSDGPTRIEAWLGAELRDTCLIGFETFLKATPSHPSAMEIAESYAVGRRWEASFIVVAALAERHRTGQGFENLEDERLMAGFFETRNSRIDEQAGVPNLHTALEEALRSRGAWEATQRQFMEPQLSQRRDYIDGLYTFMRESRDATLAASLAVEWLNRFADMAIQTETELIDRLLAMPETYEELRKIAALRVPDQRLAPERRRVWTMVGLILDFERTRAELEASGPIDPDLFWESRERLGYQRHDASPIPANSPLLAWLIQTFRPLFPMRSRPNGGTSGNSNAWDASEFLGALIRRLADDVSDEAIKLLIAFRDAPDDGYTYQLRVAAAEQRRKRVEAEWSAPDFRTVATATSDEAPTTAGQLQAVLVEALEIVQKMLRGSDVDWYRDFFNAAVPRKEEDCRDTILKMLRPLPFGIQAYPEGHLADDKRCDIICTLGNVILPIEIKGQWHRDLWTAADRQLDLRYVNDSRTDRGIYLVLWFGNDSKKRLQPPPRGTAPPRTAHELRTALQSASVTTREGRTEVIVLDVTRPI